MGTISPTLTGSPVPAWLWQGVRSGRRSSQAASCYEPAQGSRQTGALRPGERRGLTFLPRPRLAEERGMEVLLACPSLRVPSHGVENPMLLITDPHSLPPNQSLLR